MNDRDLKIFKNNYKIIKNSIKGTEYSIYLIEKSFFREDAIIKSNIKIGEEYYSIYFNQKDILNVQNIEKCFKYTIIRTLHEKQHDNLFKIIKKSLSREEKIKRILKSCTF